MSKKNNFFVKIDDTELKPQVIGQIYQKKSNIGRVLVIFVLFGLVIYYINDISLYVNNLLGKKTVDTIKEIVSTNDKTKEISSDNYYLFKEETVLIVNNLSLTHFKMDNNILSFDVYNYSENDIDLTNKNYYLNIYNNNKELVNSFKIDFNIIENNNMKTLEVEYVGEVAYINIVEK